MVALFSANVGANVAGGTFANAVSAAGSTYADATQLVADANLVTTVSNGQGVTLPSFEIGDVVFVGNGQGSNALLVYPPASGKINNLTATSGSVSIAASKGGWFLRIDSVNWIAVYA